MFFCAVTAHCQTWNMFDNHKLLPNRHYVIDSLIGNGNTLYLQCGSELTVRKYLERVKFATMRNVHERCSPINKINITKKTVAVKVVYPKKCITINYIRAN